MSHRAVRIALERFQEKLLGSCLILLNRAAPSVGHIGNQDPSEADPCLEGAWIDVERPLEKALGLLPVRYGSRSVPPGPPAHGEIARIGINRLFLLDTTGRRLHELHVEGARETAGDLVLSLRKACAIGVEPVCPNMPAGFRIDQLRVDLNL